jgi:molybdopterin synthase sulfur carrier subunit
MPVNVLIPTPMRGLTNDQEQVDAEGSTVQEVINNLQDQFPGLKERLCDDDGKLRRFVNVFVNGEDIRFEQGPDTSLKDGDELSIVPAVAGGTA